MSSAVRVERRERVATVTLDRPPLNILDLAALGALRETLAELTSDRDLQLLIVRGGGEKSFSAGVAVEDHTPDKIEAMLESFHAGLALLLDFPTPTLAAVRGHCLGGGMELAAACDLRFATQSSSFGQPEIQLGCYPPWAAACYPRLLGLGATVDLLLTGRILKTAEAAALGFVHRAVEDGDLDRALAAFADQITAHSTAVTRLAVRAIRARRELAFEPALAASERLYTDELTATADMEEGLAAFLAKRRPVWQHR